MSRKRAGMRVSTCRLAVISLSALVGSTAMSVAAASNAESRRKSVFAEAEHFELPKGWAVRKGHGIDMYVPRVSNNRTLHNRNEGTATLDVTIPKDGKYDMWLWFTKWVHDRNFELRVEQNGNVVASSRFNRPKADYANPDKEYPRNWSYNVEKGQSTAALEAGPVKLSIHAPGTANYIGSPLDCVLLTSDQDYTSPDWHHFSPQCFVRFTLLTPEAPHVLASVRSRWHRAYKHLWGGKAPDITDPQSTHVPPEEPSAWTDISSALDTAEAEATVVLTFSGKDGAPLPAAWRLRLEVAFAPDPSAVLRVLEDEWDGNEAAYVMPGDTPRHPDRVESIGAVTERHLTMVKWLPLPGGVDDFRPKHLSVEGRADSWSPRLHNREHLALAALGVNAVSLAGDQQQQAAAAAGMDFSKSFAYFFIHDKSHGGPYNTCSFDEPLEKKLRNTIHSYFDHMQTSDPVQFRNLACVTLADEPGTPNGLREHMVRCTRCQSEFRGTRASVAITARGVSPQRRVTTAVSESTSRCLASASPLTASQE